MQHTLSLLSLTLIFQYPALSRWMKESKSNCSTDIHFNGKKKKKNKLLPWKLHFLHVSMGCILQDYGFWNQTYIQTLVPLLSKWLLAFHLSKPPFIWGERKEERGGGTRETWTQLLEMRGRLDKIIPAKSLDISYAQLTPILLNNAP